jgi:hypothetical protein
LSSNDCRLEPLAPGYNINLIEIVFKPSCLGNNEKKNTWNRFNTNHGSMVVELANAEPMDTEV